MIRLTITSTRRTLARATALGGALGVALLLALLLRHAVARPAAAGGAQLHGTLRVSDPLPTNVYTLTAHAAGAPVARWTWQTPAATSSYTLDLGALGPGSVITFSVRDGAGVAGRVAQRVTLEPAPPPLALHIDFRPNFLILMTDDQRHDQMVALPQTQARIFAPGVQFDRAYVSSSLCCPSRVNSFSGRYAHNSRVWSNYEYTDDFATYPRLLHAAGYFTGLAHKYTNAWSRLYANAPRPEFDRTAPAIGYWVTGGRPPGAPPQYGTDYTRDFGLAFLAAARQQPERPFMLVLNYLAPHTPAEPDPQDAAAFRDLPPWRPPNHNPRQMPGKPAIYADQPRLSPAAVSALDDLRVRMLQTLLSVDRANAALLDQLAADGVLSNTVVIFTSDNGYHLGEFRLREKNTPYEPAIRVPLAIRYDRLIAAPRVEGVPVVNADLMPTIVALAGLPLPAGLDGRALLPLLTDTPHTLYLPLLAQAGAPARPDVTQPALRVDPRLGRAYIVLHGLNHTTDYVGLHSGRYVYIEHFDQLSELYDLAADPHQLVNVIDDPIYAARAAELRAALAAERAGWGAQLQLYGGFLAYSPFVELVNRNGTYVAALRAAQLPAQLTFTWRIGDRPPLTRTVAADRDALTINFAAPGLVPLTVTVRAPGLPPLTRTTVVNVLPSPVVEEP